ncbi:MAG: sulfatase-like hydrolase/transferase [Acidobacteria bacterium]|nr:sulfatase-like hydrolase/transferase [Acidobacteriota bacterium]
MVLSIDYIPAAAEHPGARNFTVKMSGRLAALHMASLWCIAVAQPLFDVLRRSPEFFVAHDAGPLDLLGLVLLLCLAAPAVMALALWISGWLAAGWRPGLAGTVIGALAAAVALAALKPLGGWHLSLPLAAAAGCGAAAGIAYVRSAPVRLFATFLSPALVVVPAAFLLNPAISGLLAASDDQPALDVSFDATPPVVFVVFDQLPLASLLDGDGRIDAALYPHFAALAGESTWFRNASAVAEYTGFALPAILTGSYPQRSRLPLAADYPENLFTLLGGRYRLQVREPLTELCPAALCPPARAGPAARLAALLSDLGVVYLAVVLPDDLAAALPPVTQGWRDFAARDTFAERFFAPRPDPRDTVAEFIASIGAGTAREEAALFFLHTLLPHHPWIHLRSGQRFTLQRGDVGLRNERWVDDEWAAAIRYQRHLLQVQHVDTIVGQLTTRLRETGLYDDALLVITADHGASLRPGFPFLQATEASFADVAAVPLFIKRPGQRTGATVDAGVETIDILPTLAAELGARLPWAPDGANVLDPAWSGRPARTLLAGGATRRMAGPADLRGAVMERVTHKLELFDAGDPLNPPVPDGRRDLIGRPAADFPAATAADIAVTVDAPELWGAVDPESDCAPAHATGTAGGPDGAPPPLLAIALNGVVAAVTRPYPFRAYGSDAAWEAIVDPGLLRPGANTLEVFAVEDRADGAVGLAPAYAGGGEPVAPNLLRDTAAELLGVTSTGFHGPERAEGQAFRWTTGEASLTVPIDPAAPPAALAVDVLMTGQPKRLRIEADGCIVFDDTIRNRWNETLALDGCRLTPPSLEIRLISDTHVPDGDDNRTLGVGVAAVELRAAGR